MISGNSGEIYLEGQLLLIQHQHHSRPHIWSSTNLHLQLHVPWSSKDTEFRTLLEITATHISSVVRILLPFSVGYDYSVDNNESWTGRLISYSRLIGRLTWLLIMATLSCVSKWCGMIMGITSSMTRWDFWFDIAQRVNLRYLLPVYTYIEFLTHLQHSLTHHLRATINMTSWFIFIFMDRGERLKDHVDTCLTSLPYTDPLSYGKLLPFIRRHEQLSDEDLPFLVWYLWIASSLLIKIMSLSSSLLEIVADPWPSALTWRIGLLIKLCVINKV